MDGELGSLKERSIAVEVFGRQPQFDMGDDTIVRVGAREVRKRLAQFYVTSGGAAAPVVIELPLGSYLPEFRYALVHKEAVPVQAVAAAVVAPIPIFIKSERSRLKLWVIAAAVVVVGASVTGWMYVASPATANKKAFNQFWAPVLQSNEPMLVAVGNPLVYHASWRAHTLSDKRPPAQQIPLQRPIQVPPELLNGSDIIVTIWEGQNPRLTGDGFSEERRWKSTAMKEYISGAHNESEFQWRLKRKGT